MKTLILFAHPAFHKSTVNKVLLDGLIDSESVTFHDLYEVYPDFDIDIEKEQALLLEHDCIIFHFPFFWYNIPALLKEWQDLVLVHGWAFGSKGDMLKGKLFMSALTAGGVKSGYTKMGIQNNTIPEFLNSLKQMATLCKMKWLPPFILYGTHIIEYPEILMYKQIYHKLISQLVEGYFDEEKALAFEDMNGYVTNGISNNN